MDSGIVLGLGVAALLFLLAIRVPIAIALMTVSMVGIALVRGVGPMLQIVQQEPYSFAASWTLSAIPLFILMGVLAHTTGLSSSLFHASRLWLGRLPGGLAIAANFACAGFGAASGSSLAAASAMGKIAIPDMLKYGYDKGLATGVVASAGTLGSMIPPSIAFIVYGIFASVPIDQLFIAGIFPGLLTASVYALMIYARCRANPQLAPAVLHKADRRELTRATLDLLPIGIVIFVIIGGIYGGIFTATEAGAFGAFAVLVVSTVQRRMSWAKFRSAVVEAITSTAQIFFIAIGAVLFTRFVALTGGGSVVADFASQYVASPVLLLLLAAVVYLILGLFLDPLGIILITLPIFLPAMREAGVDLVLFGVLVVKFIEIGLMTPPVGLNVFVVKSVSPVEISIEQIFKGVGWFLACEVLVVSLLIAFPQISLFLPGTMR